MDTYSDIALAIIKEQEKVIGPVAVSQAEQVSGLSVDWNAKKVVISQDPKTVINHLVAQYKTLFGQISVEVCKEAVGRLQQGMSPEQLPTSLR